ncbi:hypothetical protein DdX_16196 [Ditylenchus destructor]|uniref:Uncharacterized protein n=1 Tax=Ditylenchus destructor TaxID=166010 RepID=A0AAD4MQS3_9BILA|nr:hypothetical protein DdX_16196 [Ditylenchus destructor]
MRIPSEIFYDIFKFSSRFELDTAEISSRFLSDFVATNNSRLPLRFINCNFTTNEISAWSGHFANVISKRNFRGDFREICQILPHFIRYAYCAMLEFSEADGDEFPFSDELCDELGSVGPTMRLGLLSFRKVNFAAINAEKFREIIASFPIIRDIRFQNDCCLKSSHLSDDFLYDCASKGVYEVALNLSEKPIDGNNFQISDNGLLAFCAMRPHSRKNGTKCQNEKKCINLCIYNCQMGPQFFRKIVEARERGQLENRVRCTIGPMQMESQNLGVYLNHWELSGGKLRHRCFKFPSLHMEITFMPKCGHQVNIRCY